MEDSSSKDSQPSNANNVSLPNNKSNQPSSRQSITGSSQHLGAVQKSSSIYLKDCRICFLTSDQNDILNNPCMCKGSMSFVHEKCLIKWITQQNIRVCELCKSPFNLIEEYIGFKQLIKKNFEYLISDKRRILKLGIYLLYLYLFGKRLILIFKYFKNFIKYYAQQIFNSGKASIAKLPKLDANQLTRLQRLKLAMYKLLSFLKFVYSLFIGIQLGYLGWNESQRIKSIIKFIINNSKMIRIKSGQAPLVNNQF